MPRSGRATGEGHRVQGRLRDWGGWTSLSIHLLGGLCTGTIVLAGLVLSPPAAWCAPPKDALPEIKQTYAPIAFVGKVIDVLDVAPTASAPHQRAYSIATVTIQLKAAGDVPDTLRLLQRTVMWWDKGRLLLAAHEGECILNPKDAIAVVATLPRSGGHTSWSKYDPVWVSSYLRIIPEYGTNPDPVLYRMSVSPTRPAATEKEAEGTPVRQLMQRHYEPVGLSLSEFLRSCEAQYSR